MWQKIKQWLKAPRTLSFWEFTIMAAIWFLLGHAARKMPECGTEAVWVVYGVYAWIASSVILADLIDGFKKDPVAVPIRFGGVVALWFVGNYYDFGLIWILVSVVVWMIVVTHVISEIRKARQARTD